MAHRVVFCFFVAITIVAVLGAAFIDQDDDDDVAGDRVRRSVKKAAKKAASKNKKSGGSACSKMNLKNMNLCCDKTPGPLFDLNEVFPGVEKKDRDTTTINLLSHIMLNKFMNNANQVVFNSTTWGKWILKSAAIINPYFTKNNLLYPNNTVNVDATCEVMKKNLQGYPDEKSNPWISAFDELCEACRKSGSEMPNKQSAFISKKNTKKGAAATVEQFVLYPIVFIQCMRRKIPENCPPELNLQNSDACKAANASLIKCDKSGGAVQDIHKQAAKLKKLGSVAAKPAQAESTY